MPGFQVNTVDTTAAGDAFNGWDWQLPSKRDKRYDDCRQFCQCCWSAIYHKARRGSHPCRRLRKWKCS